MSHLPSFSPDFLNNFYGAFGPRFSWVMQPATAPESVEETWIVRARPVGSSGRMQVEARPHRRADWVSDPDAWPKAVQEIAKARQDNKGRSISRRSYTEWVSLSGAKAKARRAVEVVLRAVRVLSGPLVKWLEAQVETPTCTMRRRVRANAPLAQKRAFFEWAETQARLQA